MIVTVSDFLTEHARAIVDDRVPVITVPNGVPKRWQQERSSAEELDRLRSSHALPKNGVVLFTGKLVHWHNFGNLLQAMKQARRTVPEATLLIVGDGPMQQSIERMASEMGIAQAVRLVGTVPHEEVRQFIELADVAVVPHTNAYRSPIKLFEYMAHGKAIVAPDMAPVRSAVQNEVSALLFEPGGSGLAEAVATLLREPALGSRLGEAARERAFRDFTWEGHAARILAALAETVSDERTVAAEAVQSEH
jgi:glycosyltransferase involved in cell wall biosynthesis